MAKYSACSSARTWASVAWVGGSQPPTERWSLTGAAVFQAGSASLPVNTGGLLGLGTHSPGGPKLFVTFLTISPRDSCPWTATPRATAAIKAMPTKVLTRSVIGVLDDPYW